MSALEMRIASSFLEMIDFWFQSVRTNCLKRIRGELACLESVHVLSFFPGSFNVSKDKSPLSPTLVRFQHDLQLNGLSERSQESYGRALRKFSEFLKREPDSASEDDL